MEQSILKKETKSIKRKYGYVIIDLAQLLRRNHRFNLILNPKKAMH